VLIGEELCLLLELGVRALELVLADLELGRERLRLLQQVLGARVRLDRVEHDPDRLHELVEEALVRRAEALERRELDDGLDGAVEDDREDEDVQRGSLAEPGRDLNVVRWDVREEDLLLLDRRLPDEPLAEAEFGSDVLPRAIRVAREE